MDFDEDLIEEVRPHEFLYDTKHDDNRNTVVKAKTWTEIATHLNSNAAHCKKRWKTLRDSYRVAKNNQGLRAKKWKLLDNLDFLKDFTKLRRTSGNPFEESEDSLCKVEQKPGNPFEDSDNDSSCNELNQEQIEMKPFELIDDHALSMDNDIDISVSKYSVVENTHNYSNKQEKNHTPLREQQQADDFRKVSDKFMQVLETATKKIKQTANAVEEKDSTQLLFESLAKKIQSSHLSAQQTNALESKIVSLVYAELDKLLNPTATVVKVRSKPTVGDPLDYIDD